MPEAVSFIGLGAMGFGMATHLVQQGYSVTGFDVWAPTLERFRQAGGQTATTPAEAVRDKPLCVCMVATAQQAHAVLWQGDAPAAPTLPRDATLLLCSTVPCAYVQGLARELAERGRADVHLVDCPVSGGAVRAAEGTLSIMAAGSDEAVAKGQALLRAMADPHKLYLVEGGVGAGSNMKMCHQVLAANQILSASEVLGLAAHLGLDLATAASQVLTSRGARSWMLENRLPRLLAPDFQPVASAVTIILKDAGIITSEARRYQFPAAMTSVAEQVYMTALGRGWGADDDASVLRLYTEGVGKFDNQGGAVTGRASTDEEKLGLLVGLLEGIHLCSAAEAMAYAHHVGLDLDQVLELCVHAAGGSDMLDQVGPAMVGAFKMGGSRVVQGWQDEEAGGMSLQQVTARLQGAVDEAQRLKMPLFLGNQALNMCRLALQGATTTAELAAPSVVRAWLDR